MIDFKNVNKRYFGEDHFVLDEVTFHVDQGEFAVIVGPSGSGKSTIFKLMTREITPTSGTITVMGQQVNKIPAKMLPAYRRELGVVFQDFRLIQSMTVYENLYFAMLVTKANRSDIRERIKLVSKELDIAMFSERYPYQLSGGEQQKVAIARALMNRPKLILADEPTGNIDPAFSKRIMEHLMSVNDNPDLGCPTVLLITHEEQLVNSMGKRVIHLDHGRIISDQKQGVYSSRRRGGAV